MENKNELNINENNKENEINHEEENIENEVKMENDVNPQEKQYEAKIINVPENVEPKNVITFKIIIIGNSGVGKTSITNNAVKNIFFDNYTCGQEIYRSLITNFYRNSSLAVIVYSIEKRSSFKDVEIWIKELRIKSSPDIKIILIGNKLDLAKDREVAYEEGAKYLDEYGIIKFCETSAKTGENVRKIFEEIGIILYKDYIKYKDENSIKSTSTFRTDKINMNINKKSCCK